MKIRIINRYDQYSKFYRVGHVIWKVGEGAGKGWPDNYHVRFAIGLQNKLFYIRFERSDRVIVVLGVRFTFVKEYGGIPC